MIEIFGDFKEELPKSEQFLVISFSPCSIPLKQRWRNNGLSADFVADYLVTFFPGSEDDPTALQKQTELRSAVSYVANELLENAMKFHDESSEKPIQFGIHLLEETIVLFSTNCISSNHLNRFHTIIKELTSASLEELYIQQLEKLAEEDNNNASGMGLITIMHDYLAKLGWKLEALSTHPEVTAVTTMVCLNTY